MYSRPNKNEEELYFKLEVVKFYHEAILDWTLVKPKGIEVRDTHMKEYRIFKAGVADARCLHSHLAIALRRSHACDPIDHLIAQPFVGVAALL